MHYCCRPLSFKEITGTGKNQITFDNVDLETATKYADTIGVDMKTDNIFKMINECVEYIWDGEEPRFGRSQTLN